MKQADSLWKNYNFLKIFIGQFISVIGDGLHQVAMLWWIKNYTGSDAMVATVAICSSVFRISFGIIGGIYADRLDRRKIMIITDIIRMFITVFTAVLLIFHSLLPWHLYIFSGILGICSAFFGPSFGASMSKLVKKEQIPSLNGFYQVGFALASLIGPSLGGFLVSTIGTADVLFIDAATFGISALMIFFSKIPSLISLVNNSIKHDIKAVFLFFWKNTLLFGILILSVLTNFFFAPFMVLMPGLAKDVIKTDVAGFGLLQAMISLGFVIGGLIIGFIKVKKIGMILFWQLFLSGLLFAALGISSNLAFSASSLLLIGVISAISNVIFATVFQTEVPFEIQGRVFGVSGMISQGLQPLSLALTGSIVGVIGISKVFIGSGLAVMALSFASFFNPWFIAIKATQQPAEARESKKSVNLMLYKPSMNIIRAPKGPEKIAKGWIQEAAMRMLMNNLDPDVAEKPDDLIVYGGRGKAARNWESFYKIIEVLKRLENDQTLLVQSGKPVAVLQTQPLAPRVLIANSNLVPNWANWQEFDRLEKAGLMMYGQMTAGSWIYIGTQGILQGTFETFSSAAKKHFDGTLAGTITVTAGLGGMGGAQPLAVTLNGGVAICIEIDPSRIQRRLETRYLDESVSSLDEAVSMAQKAKEEKKALSIGLLGNAAEIVPEMVKRGFIPDLVTDQTSSHDPMWGYLPPARPDEDIDQLRKTNPDEYLIRVREAIAGHVLAILEMQKRGAIAFDYGNNLRAQAKMAGVENAFDYPGFVPAFIRDSFCEGRGPFRWVALSGDPEDIYQTDRALLKLFPDDFRLQQWLSWAGEKIAFQGLPARICWLGYRERDLAGLLFNEMVRDGRLKAPIVIGRDHLDAGSVASPYRETEAMLDGSDAVSDWPLLNFAVGVASGAAWMSFHHGGGVGMGYSQHSGLVAVADGSDEAEQRLKLCLTNDPAMGVIRHADAGYEKAKKVATERGLDLLITSPIK